MRQEILMRKCVHCGVQFSRPFHHNAWSNTKLCSRECSSAWKVRPMERRFGDKVFPDPNSGCWLWAGAKGKKGYGTFWTGLAYVRAHRLSYEMYRGPIPNGLIVMHTCDFPLCVNPDHLRLGTQADNLQDMRAKGRAWR